MNRQCTNLYKLYAGCSQIYQGDVEKIFSDPDIDLSSIESFRHHLAELGCTECEAADLDLFTDDRRSTITERDIRIDQFSIVDTRLSDKWFKSGVPAPGAFVAWDFPLPACAFATSLLSRYPGDSRTAKHARTLDVNLTTTIKTRVSSFGAPPKCGDVLGRCALEHEIGRGAFSVVFQARHTKLGIPVAVKVLLPESQQCQKELNPILSEARILAQVSHQNVVRVFEVEDEGEYSYLVMELVEGESLATRIDRGVLSPDEAIQVGVQTAEGLMAALRYGMIHRDIKPANILLASDGSVKVVDFGLGVSVRDTAGSSGLEMVGTASYMSPEVARCESNVDHRADIYSLGITLYQALAGTPPFTGSSLATVLMKHIAAAPVPLEGHRKGVPPRLNAVIQRMLEKQRADRYQTYDDLIADLRLCAQDAATEPESADPPADPQVSLKRSLFGFWFNRQPPKPRGK